MDPEMKRVIIALLEAFGGNRSKVARVLHISRNTVSALCKQMNEKNKGKPSGKDEERIKGVSNEEYQSLLKTVRRLSFRVQGIEDMYGEEIKQCNDVLKFINDGVIPRQTIIGNEFKNMVENIAKNRRDIEDLQRESGIFKEIWHDRFIEIKKKSEAHQNERDRVDAKTNERAVEVFREAERKREQGSTDVVQQKLEEKKDDKRKTLF